VPGPYPNLEMRPPSVRTITQALALLVALGAAAGSAADPIDTADAPLTTPRILWLESGAGSCGPIFDAPAAPIELVPVPYPENARLSNLEIPIRVRGVIDASGAVTWPGRAGRLRFWPSLPNRRCWPARSAPR
jgi:hypothetical protein